MKLFLTVAVLCLAGLAVGQPLKPGVRRPEGSPQRPEARRRNGGPQRFQAEPSDPEFIRFAPREPFDNPSAEAAPAPRPRPYKKTNPFSAPHPSDFRPKDTLPANGQQPKLKRKSAPEALALKQERPEFASFRPERPEPPAFRQERPEPPAFRQERPEAPAFRPEEKRVEPLKDSSAAATVRENFDDDAPAPQTRDYPAAGYDPGYDAFGQGVVNYAKGLDAERGIPDGRMQFSINGQQGPNSYRFGYDTGYGANRVFRIEEKDAYGVVHGRYGYYDSNGKLRIVNYTAHPEHGFSAEGNFGPK